MGMSHRQYLVGQRIYGCMKCKTHLATIHSMMSRVSRVPHDALGASRRENGAHGHHKAFNGQHGRAYLFDGVYVLASVWSSGLSLTIPPSYRVNVIEGEAMDRQMTTGNHTVRDIFCCKCGSNLGWKYVSRTT